MFKISTQQKQTQKQIRCPSDIPTARCVGSFLEEIQVTQIQVSHKKGVAKKLRRLRPRRTHGSRRGRAAMSLQPSGEGEKSHARTTS